MESPHIVTFLFAYFTIASVCSLAALLRFRRSLKRFIMAGLALLGVAVALIIGSVLEPGSNVFIQTIRRVLALNRPHTISAVMGIFAAIPIAFSLLAAARSDEGWGAKVAPLFMGVALLGVLLTGGALAGKELLSPFLPHPQQTVGSSAITREIDTGFVLETIANTELVPIRIAVSETGRIYISGQSGIAAQSGAVAELVPDPQSGTYLERIIATMLNRPYGLAVYQDIVYVSRSGQYTQWLRGKSKRHHTGAVTMLQDQNGDGIMDYYHDIVSNLPGARGPDYLHQNNAIAFGSDGSLFITSGIGSDRHPPSHEWEGTILRASPPGYEHVEVFAKGLRNTFGLTFGPDGELFATDNDAQSGTLANAGDKFVHVKKGSNFGHPYADYTNPAVDKPLLVSPFSLGGITYTESDKLPEKYRRCLYVVSYGEGKILRYELTKSGATYKTRPHPFAVVPGAVDIAADSNGDFYVVVHPDRRIVRIRYVQQ